MRGLGEQETSLIASISLSSGITRRTPISPIMPPCLIVNDSAHQSFHVQPGQGPRKKHYEHKRATAAVSPPCHTHRHERCASFSKHRALAIDPWPHCGGLAYGAHGSRKLCTLKMRNSSSRKNASGVASKSHEPSRTKFPALQMQNRA